MTDNVGLSTPRGSGTSGYVQRNLSHLKPRSHPYMRGPSGLSSSSHDDTTRYKQRAPDAEILDHDRKRAIEVKVFELRDKLEEEGKLDEDEVDAECDALRRKLSQESAAAAAAAPTGRRDARGGAKAETGGAGRKDIKSYDVHALAAAKIEETEKVRSAFGISKDYEEGGHWKRQEEKRREGMGRSGGEEGGRRRERD